MIHARDWVSDVQQAALATDEQAAARLADKIADIQRDAIERAAEMVEQMVAANTVPDTMAWALRQFKEGL